MQVISNDKIKKTLRVGDGFGEIALLYKSPRAFSVKACELCYMWAIDRNTFRRAVEEIIILEYEENKKFMENVTIFLAAYQMITRTQLLGLSLLRNMPKGK